jgi:hypothetical protein
MLAFIPFWLCLFVAVCDVKSQEETKDLRNEVVPVLLLLETTEGHLGTRNVLLGVLKVGKQGVLLPGDALLLVGVGVGEALNGTSLATKETVQVRADLVGTALLDSVALSTAGLEEAGTLLDVATLLVACLQYRVLANNVHFGKLWRTLEVAPSARGCQLWIASCASGKKCQRDDYNGLC